MSRLGFVGLLFVLGLAACDRAPDIYGTITLGPGVTPPSSGTLVIRAGPITRVAEYVEMTTIRVPISEVRFPLAYRLVGSGGPLGNKAWRVQAWIAEDPARESGEWRTARRS